MKIIGLGNLYCGDDAVGPLIAERINRKGIPGIDVLNWITDPVGLLDVWNNSDQFILIDAAHCDHEPGTIHRFEPGKEQLPSYLFPLSTHGFSLNDAINLLQELDRLPEYFVVYAIDGHQFGLNEPLTPAVSKAALTVEKKILSDIRNLNSVMSAAE